MNEDEDNFVFQLFLKKSTGKPRKRAKVIVTVLILILVVILLAVFGLIFSGFLPNSTEIFFEHPIERFNLTGITPNGDEPKSIVLIGGFRSNISESIVEDVYTLQMDSCNGLPKSLPRPKTGKRTSSSVITEKDILVSCFFYDLDKTMDCFTYNKTTSDWKSGIQFSLDNLPKTRRAIAIEDYFIFPDASGISLYAFDILRKNLTKYTWENANLKIVAGSCLVAFDDVIMVSGGRDKSWKIAFKIETRIGKGKVFESFSLPSMNEGRSFHGCGRVFTQNSSKFGLLIVAGGVSELGGILNSVEVLDPLWSQWRLMSPLTQSRWQYPSIGLFKGQLAVVGGFDTEGNGVSPIDLYTEGVHEWKKSKDETIRSVRGGHSTTEIRNTTCVGKDKVIDAINFENVIFPKTIS